MTFIDMFCGMGTIRMGFEQAGHTCVYSVEWDKHKRKIYEVIFGNEPEGRDITAVRGSDLPLADCWCFGAPCQDFSIAGLRSGMEGDRSSLVREVFRLVRETPEEHRPEWLLYENVKGMLSSNKGLDYLEILFEMASLGYDIQYELLNSKDFGVPQNRERVYTLGHLRKRGERKVFPIGGEVNETDCRQFTDGPGIAYCLDTGYGKGISPNYTNKAKRTQVIQLGNVMPTATRENPNQGRVYSPTGLAPSLSSVHGGGIRPHIPEPCACLTPDRLEKQQNGRRFKEPGEPMFTLTNQDIHGVALKCVGNLNNGNSQRGRVYDENGLSPSLCSHSDTGAGLEPKITNGTRIRRLTPRECMRLQGVPDYITDKLIAAGISDTQMYRAAGDACTVNVIYEIARAMAEQWAGPNNKL